MRRRQYIKSLSVLSILPSSISVGENESEDEVEEKHFNWNVRAVWRRKDDTGFLNVRDKGIEAEFENRRTWARSTIQYVSAVSNHSHVVDLFDFELVSIYDGAYARSHFTHDNGLEVTIRRNPNEEVEYSAFVRHVGENWDEAREYASTSQIALVQKIQRERDEYLEE